MRLADVMEAVKVGMQMVVRKEEEPEYAVIGGKVTEKNYDYVCLDVQGVPWGITSPEDYQVLKLYDENGTELFEKGAWNLISKYIPNAVTEEEILSGALDLWGCYTDEVKSKVGYALGKVIDAYDMKRFLDELSEKHKQIANLLGYEDYCEDIDEDMEKEMTEESDAYNPDSYEEDGTEESLYLENTALKKLMEIQMMLEKVKQKDEQKESVNA